MSGNGNKGQMKVQEIVSRLKMFELNVSLDDLRRPTSELVCEVYRTLVIALMGINERELGQATFYGLENLDHPSLHEQSIPFINFYTNIQKLMTVVGIQDFGLVDLYAPTTQRFMVHIVHLLNFVKFKGDCTKLRNKLEQETVGGFFIYRVKSFILSISNRMCCGKEISVLLSNLKIFM